MKKTTSDVLLVKKKSFEKDSGRPININHKHSSRNLWIGRAF